VDAADALRGEFTLRGQQDVTELVDDQQDGVDELGAGLEVRLRIGAKRSRRLVALLRSEAQAQANRGAEDRDVASEDGIAQAA
jgi:hypothetical protein